jgi:phosphoribosylglycinamide formyltransferase-1
MTAVRRLAFLSSHGGTTLQAVLEACRVGTLDATVAVVISNNSRSLALARARSAGVPGYHLSGHTHPDPAVLDAAITDALDTHDVGVIVLAGYMKLLGPRTLARYTGRILNVHPALLPGFGGTGMYGDRVHEAVLAAGHRITGVTVHLADAEYDHGPILARREIPVEPGDTVESLRQRVQSHEAPLLVEVLRDYFCSAGR